MVLLRGKESDFGKQVFQNEKAQNIGHELMGIENYRRFEKKKPYLP